jgi:Putative adhesin
MHKNRQIALFSAVLLAMLSLAHPALGRVDGRFERNLQVNGAVDLEVLSHSGNVTVKSGPDGTVKVIGKIYASHNWLWGGDGDKAVREVQQNPPIRQNGNSIKIDYLDIRNVSVDYEITAPSNTNVRSHTGSGDQSIEGLNSRIELESGSGEIVLRNLTGEVRVETGSGNVRGEHISGPVTARASSGNIRLEETGSGDLVTRAGSGNIEVIGVNGGLHSETGSGNQRIAGVPAGAWTVRSGSGNTELRVPSSASYDVDISTGSGNVTVDQPVTTTVQGRVQEGRHSITGKVHGGGNLIQVHTGSGDVTIQ